MALIVEDGSGLPNSDSYVSLADAAAYFVRIGNTDWFDDEAALVVGTQALDLLFQERFPSTILKQSQALLWPRVEFTGADGKRKVGVPAEVQKATCELALLHQQGTKLIGDPDREAQLEEVSQRVGDLETTRKYLAGVSTSKLRKVSLLLKPVLRPGGLAGALRIVRA